MTGDLEVEVDVDTNQGRKSWVTAMLFGVAAGVMASGLTAIAVAITNAGANLS